MSPRFMEMMAQENRSPLQEHQPPLATDDGAWCWLEVARSPYQPNHQVELLHLQAEADALLIKLQTINQQRANQT